MTTKNKDIIVFTVIYVITFTIILQYNLLHPLVNDGVYEYRDYLLNIEVGWEYRNSLLNSCLIPIWIPSLIQRLTGWDAMFIFRVFPPFFYALMPAFVYLISRRYLDLKYSVVSSLVVISSSYILYFPDVGRVGIALGLMAGMVWALLERKLIWAICFAVLLVFSHYGTAIIAIGASGIVFGAIALWNKLNFKRCWYLIKPYAITCCVLIILMGVWHFGIAKYSGGIMFSTMLQPEKAEEIMGEGWGEMDILELEDRDFVTQKAFGLTLGNESIPGKIEIVANWLVVMFVTLGLYILLRNKVVDMPFKIMLIALYGLILLTIAIPAISVYYGTLRVYFTALMVMAVCFPFGIGWVSSKLHLPPLLLIVVVLSLYAVSTSGIVYLPFGLVKFLPVVVTLP